MSEWQDISTAPLENGVEVLGWGRLRSGHLMRGIMIWFEVGTDFNGVRGWWTLHALPFEPTHWMPLPEPPAGEVGTLADATKRRSP